MVVHQEARVPAPAGSGPKPILELARHLTLRPLREAVADLHPDLARICAYHLGWCDAEGTPSGKHQGKLVRAALVLLSARAAGSDPALAVPGAVAVELTHSFSLLHDDIMDGDELRRGRPAAWVVYGRGKAVLAGDAMMGRALRCQAELPAETGRALGAFLVDALNEIIHGQAADLALEQRGAADVTVEEYLDSCEKTTGLLGGCAAIGAALGGAPPETVESMRRASCHLGLAWQMANDIENIWGDPASTGKPAFGDLRQCKKTLPVVSALRSGTVHGERLAGMMTAAGQTPSEPPEEELRVQAELIERAGGRASAESLSREHLDRAHAYLDEAVPAARDRAELGVLFDFIAGRRAPAA